jgi:hypothetical protein
LRTDQRPVGGVDVEVQGKCAGLTTEALFWLCAFRIPHAKQAPVPLRHTGPDNRFEQRGLFEHRPATMTGELLTQMR